jgi:hypothetical protein
VLGIEQAVIPGVRAMAAETEKPRGPRPRYRVRAISNGLYCVWDADKDAVASSPDGCRQCDDLRLEEAFDMIDQLIESEDP